MLAVEAMGKDAVTVTVAEPVVSVSTEITEKFEVGILSGRRKLVPLILDICPCLAKYRHPFNRLGGRVRVKEDVSNACKARHVLVL